MKTPMLMILAAVAVPLVGCERKPKEPAPIPSAANAVAPVLTNPEATAINRPVENPPLTNRAATNAPPPPRPP
jgi:hypothetical protein